jgi:hypothetical protein
MIIDTLTLSAVLTVTVITIFLLGTRNRTSCKKLSDRLASREKRN